jgi:hypothetical protein
MTFFPSFNFFHGFKKGTVLHTSLLAVGAIACGSVLHPQQALALDFTPDGLQSGSINGALFEEISDNNAAGTGLIDSFVRIQNNGTEQGYNTDGALEFDTKNGPTRSLLLNDVPTVTKDGTAYRQFILDINEPNGKDSAINLTALQIFLGNAPNLTGYSPTTGFGSNATKIYDLGNNVINLNDTNQGSGRYDLLAYIPDSVFTGPNSYVYLYSAFNNAEGGFEEWAVGKATPVPTPALLPGLIAMGIGVFRKRQSKSAEPTAE